MKRIRISTSQRRLSGKGNPLGIEQKLKLTILPNGISTNEPILENQTLKILWDYFKIKTDPGQKTRQRLTKKEKEKERTNLVVDFEN